MELFTRFLLDEEGADATEYILVIGLVALAIILGAIALGGALNGAFNKIGGCVNNAVPGNAAAC